MMFDHKEYDRLTAQKTNDDRDMTKFKAMDEADLRRVIAGYESTIRTQIETIHMLERLIAAALPGKKEDYS